MAGLGRRQLRTAWLPVRAGTDTVDDTRALPHGPADDGPSVGGGQAPLRRVVRALLALQQQTGARVEDHHLGGAGVRVVAVRQTDRDPVPTEPVDGVAEVAHPRYGGRHLIERG